MSRGAATERVPVKAISFVGPSNVGKTEVICRLVRWLTGQGFTTAVVKHSHHVLPAASPEAVDCQRAGAAAFAMAAGGVVQINRFLSGEPDLFSLLGLLGSQADVILVEGYKTGPLPKILLQGAEKAEPPPAGGQVVALLTPELTPGPLPIFHPSDVEGLGRFVVAFLGLTLPV